MTPDTGGRALAASAVAYWTATGVGLIGSLLRGKVSAVVLGAAGLGVSAQLSTFSALVVAVAALGLGTGGVKMIAQARSVSDSETVSRLVSFLLWGPTLVGLVFLGLVSVFATSLSRLLLGSGSYGGLLVVASAAIPLLLFLGSIQIVMQAYEQARRLALNSIISAVVTTAAAVPLTLHYGLRGAVASAPIAAAGTLAFFCVRERWVLALAFPVRTLRATTARHLLTIAGASLVASVLTLGSDTALRSAAVHQLGIVDNGVYQPVQMLSTLVLAQMAGALSLVLLPRLSYELGLGNRAAVLSTLGRAARTSLVFVVALVLLTMALRDVFIVVFFDRSFLAGSDVLALQLTAEVPRFAAYAIGAVLLPAGLVREWLVSAVLSNALRLVIGFALLPSLGLRALAVSVVAQWVVVLGWTVAVVHRKLEWRPEPGLVRLTAAAVATVTLACVLAITLGRWEGGALLCVASGAWVMIVGRDDVRHLLHATVLRTRRPART